MSTVPVHRRRGPAADLHSVDLPVGEGPEIWVMEATAPAIVLGSAQAEADLDAAAVRRAGLVVARRRSGGGAVLVVPGELWWVDVTLPRHDRRWDDDVGRSGLWLGDAFVAALGAVGLEGAVAHPGPMRRSRWSGTVCFAGLGPGEVTVDGAKVVGVSQRRDRRGARFQCAVPLSWEAAATVGLLALDPAEAGALTEDLARSVRAVDSTPSHLLAALRDALTA